MKLVLATRNRDKAREILAMLEGLDLDVVTLADFPAAPETVEDGETLEANALKKAREACDHTGLSALADDTGLEVAALGGAPGVFAARYAGERATYADNYRKLLAAMNDVPSSKRGARFRTVMALVLSSDDAARLARAASGHPEIALLGSGDHLMSEGILHGKIAMAASGDRGFGYDPVFVDSAHNRTLAEMTPDEKNRSSHRYRALLEMREMLLRFGLVREKESAR
ncbi:MAG TPA: non-canonical purine NTP pyrophosphatase [Candidatus Krumholzibacteria bacterium]|nr:non-canonical purine NTP pyrophosphatase [Candidatus Krumholzibacteria bacterium]